jgi:hypothetical protein
MNTEGSELFGSSAAGKKGGNARKKALSKEERKDIARMGAQARWGASVPIATHNGTITLGDVQIPCAVLEDGTRLLTQFGFLQAVGRSGRPAAGRGSSFERRAPFLDSDNLKPFVDDELSVSSKPVAFRMSSGGMAHGYRAELLPRVCEVYLKARDAGKLRADQLKFAFACELVVRGLARVGIIALVDEATGYQKDRARDALAKILESFVAKEIQKWVKTFPSEFYEHMFRLWGVSYDPTKPTIKRPQYFGALTNNFVYTRLAPGVLAELRKKNPASDSGQRSHKHHQHLTRDIGHPKLLEHLSAVTALMRASNSKEMFLQLLDKALPKHIDMPLFEDKSKESRSDE